MHLINCNEIYRKRIFILGPCHNVRISTCALSTFTTMKTPLYDLNVDTASEFLKYHYVFR